MIVFLLGLVSDVVLLRLMNRLRMGSTIVHVRDTCVKLPLPAGYHVGPQYKDSASGRKGAYSTWVDIQLIVRGCLLGEGLGLGARVAWRWALT